MAVYWPGNAGFRGAPCRYAQAGPLASGTETSPGSADDRIRLRNIHHGHGRTMEYFPHDYVDWEGKHVGPARRTGDQAPGLPWSVLSRRSWRQEMSGSVSIQEPYDDTVEPALPFNHPKQMRSHSRAHSDRLKQNVTQAIPFTPRKSTLGRSPCRQHEGDSWGAGLITPWRCDPGPTPSSSSRA